MKEGASPPPAHTRARARADLYTGGGAIRYPAIGAEVRVVTRSPIAPKHGKRLEVIEGKAAGLLRRRGKKIMSKDKCPVPTRPVCS